MDVIEVNTGLEFEPSIGLVKGGGNPILVDLCCGNKKREGAIGLDFAPIPGVVDIVHDLDQTPWPIESNSVDSLFCEHGIEHVGDIVAFIRECHRILKPGAEMKIITPHFSSNNSFIDPTHLRHLSAFWFKPFCEGGYLANSSCKFALGETHVSFGKSISAKIGSLLVALQGLEKWERKSAWRYPGVDVETRLFCVKNGSRI